MRGIRLCVLMGLVGVLTGCGSMQALNLQRAGLRGAGDLTVTAYLDQVADAAWTAHQQELAGVVGRLDAFLATGEAKLLVHEKLVAAVRGLVPAAYQSLADGMLAAAQFTTADVPIEKIGADNMARMSAFLNGAATGLREYKAEHRPPPATPEAGPVAPAPAPAPAPDAVSPNA